MLHAVLPSLSRRAALVLGGALIFLAPAGMHEASAQRLGPAPEVSVEDLMKPAALPDIGIGPADAKVTVIEYSSLTCPHCAHFAAQVFPAFKAKYIDTGKVRFITREFPLDNLAAGASMLVRCAEPDKQFAFVDNLFSTQDAWAHGEGPAVARLFEAAKPAGFTKESFDKCLTDQALLDKINAARTQAGEKFQINSTPTFFVNGKRLAGVSQVDDFAKLIDPILEGK